MGASQAPMSAISSNPVAGMPVGGMAGNSDLGVFNSMGNGSVNGQQNSGLSSIQQQKRKISLVGRGG